MSEEIPENEQELVPMSTAIIQHEITIGDTLIEFITKFRDRDKSNLDDIRVEALNSAAGRWLTYIELKQKGLKEDVFGKPGF